MKSQYSIEKKNVINKDHLNQFNDIYIRSSLRRSINVAPT